MLDPIPVNFTNSSINPLLLPDPYSIFFDKAIGKLNVVGNSLDNRLYESISSTGYLELTLDQNHFSSDPYSQYFYAGITGATKDTLTGINFDGGDGRDSLFIGDQTVKSLNIQTEDNLIISGNIFTDFLTTNADTLTVKNANITASTNNKGGTIQLLGNHVEVLNSNLNASGNLSGGTILVGGDYEGKGQVQNAQTTFISKDSTIQANALQSGNGGKVIIWADGNTDFRGDIKARGGAESGDGGFVEVSGKQNLNFIGDVDVDATKGKQGSVLFDPSDIIINPDSGEYGTYSFRLSNLENIKGDVTLSATNSIIFNAKVVFTSESSRNINIKAGGLVSLLGFSTYGRNLNISAGSIINGRGGGYYDKDGWFQTDTISSFATSLQSGNIKLISRNEVNLGKSWIDSGNTFGNNAGNITVKANTSITTGWLTSYASSGGGNIEVSTKGDIVTETITTNETNGNIKVTSTGGNIRVNSIGTDSVGNAGKITLNGYGDIRIGNISSSSYGKGAGGEVKITSQTGKIINSLGRDMVTSAANGNAGNVTLKAYGDIITSSIYSDALTVGNGGSVKVTSQTGKIITNTNFYQTIKAGNITTTSMTGNAGSVKVEAAGDIEIGAVASNVVAGSGKGGNISVTTSNGNITSEYLRSDSVNGTGGSITLDAGPKLGTSGGTIRVINTVNISGADFSIFAGINGDPKIKISHVPLPDPDDFLGSFTIGDAKLNGTAGIIMAGTDVIVDNLPIKGSYNLGNIIIRTLDLASNEDIKKRVQKSFDEAFKPIGINIATRELTNRTGIPALVSYLPEIKRLQVAKELAIEAASNDPKLSADKLVVASKVFFDIKRILDSSQKYGVTDKAQIAYILATASWESQFGTTKYGLYETSFNPIGSPADINYFSNQYDNSLGNRGRGSGDGFRYRGRGYVQLTGRDNYIRFQQIFGVDITATSNQQTVNGQTKYSDEGDPDKVATDRNLAADILVLGIRDDLFTQGGRNIGQFISGNNLNFFDARGIINGDKNTKNKGEQFSIGELISMSAQRYLNVLKKI